MAELEIEDGGDRTEVRLKGRLDIEGVQQVENRFALHVGSRRRPTLVDLSELEFIASLGLGMLLRAARGLSAHQARMVLVGPRDLVARALTAAGFEHLIPIAADREEAVKLLEGP